MVSATEVSPTGVIEIVVVEMDGAVLVGLARPIVLLAGPVPALHGAGRQLHQRAVQPIGADIDRGDAFRSPWRNPSAR